MSYPLGHDLFTLVDLDQNSDAWLTWRKTGIGSSDAPAVLGESPWTSRKELWEQKVVEYHGAKAPLSVAQFKAIREQMAKREGQNESSKNRGKKLEPVARAEFEDMTGLTMEAVCGHHTHHPHLKVSLDGWNAGRRAFLEIKAPKQSSHAAALDGRVPDYYRAQILHQFLVSGAREAWYLSFHDKYPPGQRMALVHVTPANSCHTLGMDEPLGDLVAALGAAESDFWTCVTTGVYREAGE